MSELLAPAGNIEALDAAIGEGADAVYMGLKSFNARMRSSNFAWNQFEAAVQAVHRQHKKIYVTVNTVVEERETERLYRFLEYLNRVKPDGLIVQDFGLVRMCQEFFPELELHASTQMNIASSRAANLMGKEGFKRVVLARELGLNEIQDIKAKSNIELEVFVHGALCVCESGLCLFSSYLGGKSANRGMCAQACRRLYKAEYDDGISEGYYFSPNDLQLIDKIPDLVQAGVESFKIEGRMKSAEYVGSVTAAYRYLLDNWENDKKGSIANAKRMLATDFARSKTRYWYDFKSPDTIADEILNPNQAGGTGIYLGVIDRTKYFENDEGKSVPFISLSGGSYDPDEGDSLRFHKKDDTGRESYKVRTVITDENGNRWIDFPRGFKQGDTVYLLQTKSMSKRYSRVLPRDLSGFRKQPGDMELPVLDLTNVEKSKLDYFPQGLYFQVSTVSDLFVVQSENPIRVILELNTQTRQSLLEKKENLPFSKKQVIISLDPFCPQEIEDSLEQTLHDLVEQGFKTFIVNNPSHISMLRQISSSGASAVNMIAGPYLYAFNRWAASWLENQDIDVFVSPYENSRQNVEATYENVQRSRVLLPIFAYPALFRMRFQLPKSYDFLFFTDKEEDTFKALSTQDGSFVLPEKPFSILDKTQFLRSAGFSHFLIDFSKTKVTKSALRNIMKSFYKAEPLQDISRFNWKDGFYNPEKMEEYRQMNSNVLSKNAKDYRQTSERKFERKSAGEKRNRSKKSSNTSGRKH